MRDSFIQDSFTEDALLSAWDQLLLALSFTGGKEGRSGEQQTIVRDAGPHDATAASMTFRLLHTIGTRVVLDRVTRAVVVN